MDTYRIGMYIKKILKAQQKSQKQLAEHMRVSKQVLSNSLRGANQLSIEKLVLISEFLRVPIECLINLGEVERSKLEKFSTMVIQEVDILSVPKQPDQFGKTLLEYIIDRDDVDRFLYFYKSKCFIEPLHNSVRLITFLIRNNMIDFLKKPVISKIQIQNGNIIDHIEIERPFEVPDLDRICNIGKESKQIKRRTKYHELSIEIKEFVNVIMNFESDALLRILTYKSIGGRNCDFPQLFYYAIDEDCTNVIEYYRNKFECKILPMHMKRAIDSNSINVIKYFEKVTHALFKPYIFNIKDSSSS